jgi:hypothetical protein
VADRDPETIKQDIDLKARAIEFVKKPVVIASLAGISSVVVVVVVRRIRNR